MSRLNVFGLSSSRILLALLLVGAVAAGVTDGRAENGSEPTREQLSRLSDAIQNAGRNVRYQAEQTVYEYLGDRIHVTRYRIQHAYPFLKKEIINGPEGGRVIMLEDGASLWSYFPDKGIVVKEEVKPSDHILPVEMPENLDLLVRNYRIVLRGPVTVDDGLECQVVEFLPRKADRPSRELWLEVKRKLLVRLYMDFPDGRPAYRTELKRILWDPDFDGETFQIKVPRETKVFEVQKRGNLSLEEAGRLLNRRVMLPLFVPDGYATSDIVLRVEAPTKRLQVIYSDGLSSYSVFQEWTEPSAVLAESASGAVPSAASVSPSDDRSPGGTKPGANGCSAPALDVPHAYRYGLITVVTYDHGGKRTVGVGDIGQERLLDVVRSLQDAQ